MPATYVIDRENRTVLFVLRELVTLRGLAQENTRLNNDPAFDPGFSEVIDFTGVSEVQMGYADFRALQEGDPFFASSKRALIVGCSSESFYGAARMYRVMHGAKLRVEIFKNKEEALRWLTSG